MPVDFKSQIEFIPEKQDQPDPKLKAIADKTIQYTSPGYKQENELRNHSYLRDLISGLPVIGSIAGSIAGPVGGAAGTTLGTVAKQEIQNRLYNEGPKDVGSSLGEIGTNVVLNDIAPPFISKIASGLMNPKVVAGKVLGSKALRQASPVKEAVQGDIENTLNRNYIREDYPVVRDAANKANSSIVSVPPSRWNKTVGEDLLQIPNRQVGPVRVSDKDIIKQALSSVSEVKNFKILTGGSDEIEKLAINKLVHRGYSAGEKSFNPAKVLDEFKGPDKDIYREAIRPQTAKDFTDFLTSAQDRLNAGNILHMGDRGKLYLGIATAGSLVTGHIPATAAGLGSVILGKAAVTKLMSNPEIRQLAIQATKTPLNLPQSKFFTNVITNVLRGTDVYINTPDGEEKATFDDKGQLTYPRP